MQIPTDTEHAKTLDTKNRHYFLIKAIEKEMPAALIAFEILEDNVLLSVRHKKITGLLAFDVKTHFSHKVR